MWTVSLPVALDGLKSLFLNHVCVGQTRIDVCLAHKDPGRERSRTVRYERCVCSRSHVLPALQLWGVRSWHEGSRPSLGFSGLRAGSSRALDWRNPG